MVYILTVPHPVNTESGPEIQPVRIIGPEGECRLAHAAPLLYPPALGLPVAGFIDIIPVFLGHGIIEHQVGIPGQLFVEITPDACIGVIGEVIQEGGTFAIP